MNASELRAVMRRSFHTDRLTTFDHEIALWAIPSGAVSVAELTSKLRDLADDLRALADDVEGGGA